MLASLFDEVADFQVLRTPILKKSANGCLVHNISLKTLKLDQGATEMFISEFEIKESLCKCNVRNIQEARSFKRLPELSEMISYYLFFSFFVRKDSISLISKEFHICDLTTFTRDVFRTQSNIYNGVFLRE